jgi:hypothetical protein
MCLQAAGASTPKLVQDCWTQHPHLSRGVDVEHSVANLRPADTSAVAAPLVTATSSDAWAATDLRMSLGFNFRRATWCFKVESGGPWALGVLPGSVVCLPPVAESAATADLYPAGSFGFCSSGGRVVSDGREQVLSGVDPPSFDHADAEVELTLHLETGVLELEVRPLRDGQEEGGAASQRQWRLEGLPVGGKQQYRAFVNMRQEQTAVRLQSCHVEHSEVRSYTFSALKLLCN